MGLIDLDNVKLGQGEDFPPTENFLHLHTQQGQINWLAQALTELNEAAEGCGKYELPVATADTLGGVKKGSGVTIAADGAISIAADNGLEVANDTIKAKLGSGMKLTDGAITPNLGSGLELDGTGAIQATATSKLTKQVGPLHAIKADAWSGGTTASILYHTEGHNYDVENDIIIIGPESTGRQLWIDHGVYVSSVDTAAQDGYTIITFSADTTPTDAIMVNIAIIYEEA